LLYIAECGNAYANGTLLPSTVDTDQDCTTIGWISSPFPTTSFPIKETGIGLGNRSCVGNGNRPCYVYGPSGINVASAPGPVTPPVSISFAGDPTGTGAEPSSTSTMLTPSGSPIAVGKAQHALISVVDDVFKPNGTVTVTEGSNTVGTGALSEGVADVTLTTPLGLGNHSLVAHYPGDGSFSASDSAPTTMSVIGANNVSIGDVSIVSGTGGVRSMSFPVVLSQPPSGPVVVPYSLHSGSAVAGTDFIDAKPNSALTFKSGMTIKPITVKLKNDVPTGPKTFTVQLGNPTNGYVLRDGVGTGTILDPQSGGPTVNVGDASLAEGDVGGAHALKFAVTLSEPPTHATLVTVRIFTGPTQSATKGSKANHADYNSRYQFVVPFKPGASGKPGPVSKYVSAQVWPDTFEGALAGDVGDDTFTVQLYSVAADPAQPFTLGRSMGTGVISADD
jgi:hypothetical protein